MSRAAREQLTDTTARSDRSLAAKIKFPFCKAELATAIKAVNTGKTLEAVSILSSLMALASEETRPNKTNWEPGDEARYLIDAAYTNNGQLYGDYFPGECALHAQINALMDRAKEGDEIQIIECIDRMTDLPVGHIQGMDDVRLEPHRSAVLATAKLAAKAAEFHTRDPKDLAVARFWLTACGYKFLKFDAHKWDDKKDLDYLLEFHRPEASTSGHHASIGKVRFLPSASLARLAHLAKQVVDMTKADEGIWDRPAGVTSIYQAEALSVYYKDEIDSIFGGSRADYAKCKIHFF
jgi:hypothetical protein